MAKMKIDWNAMYPEGFVSCFSMRRLSKTNHKRAKVQAAMRDEPLELVMVKAIEIGLTYLENEWMAEEGE